MDKKSYDARYTRPESDLAVTLSISAGSVEEAKGKADDKMERIHDEYDLKTIHHDETLVWNREDGFL